MIVVSGVTPSDYITRVVANGDGQIYVLSSPQAGVEDQMAVGVADDEAQFAPLYE